MAANVIIGKYEQDYWIRPISKDVEVDQQLRDRLFKEISKIGHNFVIKAELSDNKLYLKDVPFLDVELESQPSDVRKTLLKDFFSSYLSRSDDIKLSNDSITVTILEKSWNSDKGEFEYLCGTKVEH